MDKKRIILLSLLLGTALALLLLLVLLLVGRDRTPSAQAPAARSQDAASPAAEAPTALPGTDAPAEQPAASPTEDARVQLSAGPVDRNATELVLSSVTEADLPLLRQLAGLTRLDGRACADGALLHTFSETVSYPVLWSVSLGDLRLDSDAEEVAVPAGVSTAQQVQAALDDLPAVKTVDLRQSGLDPEQTAALQAARPELAYRLPSAIPEDLEGGALTLEADAVSDWGALAQQIAQRSDITGITVNGALTLDQAACLLEGAGSIPAAYSVTVEGRTISTEDVEADFSDLPAAKMGAIQSALAVLPKLQKVRLDDRDGKSSWTLDEADQLQAFRAGLLVDYTYTDKSLGVSFSLADEVVTFKKKNLKRKLEQVKELLPYMRNVKRVDMENCGLDNETMAALRDQFPQPKIVWRVKVGAYSVRTDAWMIKFSAGEGKSLQDKDVKNLKYCREIRYMDLGHNSLHHMDFVANMPDLEVCIMYNPLSNIKGVESCPKLEFFECYSCGLKDLSPLTNCTEMKHLNVCYNHITDITPLYGLTKLERLWISRNNVPADQMAKFKELVPGCEVNTTTHNPTRGGWRYYDEAFTQITPRYALLRQQFRYDFTRLRSYGDGWWDDGKVHLGDQPPIRTADKE